MLRRMLVATMAPFCAALVAGCGSLSLPDLLGTGLLDAVHLTGDDSGAEVTVAHGQQLIVRLPVLADSGYAWALREPMSAVVKPEGAPTPAKPPAAGAAGGSEVWVFTPVRNGEQLLRFENRRGAQPDAPPAGVVSYNVRVR
jgi:predicted secreted protein